MKYFDPEKFNKLSEERHNEYVNASPFAHIVLFDLFDNDVLKKIHDEFPSMEKHMKGKSNKTTLQKLSFRQPEKLKLFEPITKEFCQELNSKEFCLFLEKLTGIKDIQSDPYLEGGGPHEIRQGGFLKMHVDFNIHPITNLDRRINVLVYLNDNWPDEYGGNLDLWDTEMGSLKISVPPRKNTTVIFNTTDNSWHGHPDPVTCPEHRSRRSMAFYYYTKSTTDKNKKGHSTIYKPRPGDLF
jgi:Rps23 Pro-64 3,4-dihydroxylase Tpa1-like proline 4-hydroxylase